MFSMILVTNVSSGLKLESMGENATSKLDALFGRQIKETGSAAPELTSNVDNPPDDDLPF